MTKSNVLEYDITAASNNSDIAGISILGTAPTSNFDNAFRELMLEIGASVTRHVAKAAGTYTAVKADHNQFWRATGAVTLNLTAAATLTTGWALYVMANGGAITIDPSGAETINGAATLVIPDGSGAAILCTGTAFFANVIGSAAGPTSASDKAIARFNGTTGKIIQNSAATIDDSGNLTASGAISSSTTFQSSTSSVILAPTGAGGVYLRPNGAASLTGQAVVDNTGALTGTGTFTSGTTFQSSTSNVVLAPTGAGFVLLRPNGAGSTTGQMTVSSAGAVVVADALTANNLAIFNVSSNEICRVDSTSLTIGKTSPNLTAAGTSFFGTSTSKGLFQCTRDHNIVGQFNVINPVGTETIIEFHTSGTAKGSVTINGSTTAYNTTSDRRLKENPRPFDSGAILDKLKVYQFDWKAGGSGYGVFAQEAVKVFPDAVAKGKGKKHWQVDYSKYVPLLIRECQSLREEIKALKSSR